MIEEFSDRSKHIFKLAHDLAIKQNNTLIAHHILYALIEKSDQYINNILRKGSPILHDKFNFNYCVGLRQDLLFSL